MSVLLDVNLLLAYGWKSHGDHTRTRKWVSGLEEFTTCPITELGFLRVSMSPAYRADFGAALTVLNAIKALNGAKFIGDSVAAGELPTATSYKDITDVYLVTLAASTESRLATLDRRLVKANWALGIAYHPFAE